MRWLSTHIFCASLLVALLSTTHAIGQSDTASAASIPPPHTLSDFHRQVNDRADLVRSGNLTSIVSLSQTVFERVGIPVEVASGLKYTQRLAQAEVDYRAGRQKPVQEEDLVKAVNHFVQAINAPEWASTDQAEVRRLRMQFMVRYPQLLAKQGPPDADGKFEALDKNMSPVEALFLATSLFYQKLYQPEFQITAEEKAAGGASLLPPAEFKDRTQILHRILQGKSDNVDLVDLARAAEVFWGDLGINTTLRADFESQYLTVAQSSMEGGRQ